MKKGIVVDVRRCRFMPDDCAVRPSPRALAAWVCYKNLCRAGPTSQTRRVAQGPHHHNGGPVSEPESKKLRRTGK